MLFFVYTRISKKMIIEDFAKNDDVYNNTIPDT